MLHLNISFNRYFKAYTLKNDPEQMLIMLEEAYKASLEMEKALRISEHDDFDKWLRGDEMGGKFNIKKFFI